MNNTDTQAFAKLFSEAYERCFGYAMKDALTESESKLFSSAIFENTGLVIGWKSLKNYSQYLISDLSVREENPSIATMDTLARFVMRAPRTDEVRRKENESHYPYWFEYRNQLRRGSAGKPSNFPVPARILIIAAVFFSGLIVVLALILWFHPFSTGKTESFDENFRSLEEDSLAIHGWFVESIDSTYWNRRADAPGFLTLFTLRGDNWPDSGETPNIPNLLLRKISSDCFTVEVHMSDFVPTENWKQAGLILLEDMNFAGKSARLSIAYNDYSGGYPKSRQILIQAITSLGASFSKPEEIANQPIFTIDIGKDSLVEMNLRNSALRIEKIGDRYRFLFSDGPMENSAFKEVANREFDMRPKYVGLFAMKGFVNDTNVVPVHFKFFRLIGEPCSKR